ncbi:ABC transporter substrate-binding protein [Nonomuraea insulae]|uniref:ABC transporter substrate-binding protein n=1 Tax=Nonomuraea insulae TaxID=1616787 RepID=A0ABW1D7C4_9ACTN
MRKPFRVPSPAASRIWFALLTVLAVTLSGCASAGRGSSRGAAPDETLQVRIRATSMSFTDLPTAVIHARGYFAQVGLKATFEPGVSNASLVTQGVISGDSDVGVSGTSAIYNAYAEGATGLVSLGTTNRSLTFGLALNRKTVDALARRGVTPDSPVKDRVQALRGLSLAASPAGSTGNAYLRIMLSEHGVKPDTDVTIIPNNDAAAQIAATRQGRANGFAQSFPRTNLPEAEGWGALWLNWAEDLPSLLPLASQDYYTTRSWLAEHPDTAKRVMQAVWLAHRDLQNPTGELRDAVRKLPEFADMNKAAFDKGWALAVGAYKGVTPLTTRQMFDNELKLVNYNRDAPMRIDFDDVYDLSAAKAAQPR